MVKVSEIKADLEALRASQVTKAGSTDPLLMGVMVNRQDKLCTLTTFDGISCTKISDRNWGQNIPEGGFVLPAGFAQIFKMIDKGADIEIRKVKTGQIEVKNGTSKWRFPMATNTSAFYPIGDDILSNKVEATSISLDAELMREAIVNIYKSIGEEHSALCCAQFIFNPKMGELTAIATDSRRSTVWKAVNVKYPNLPLPEYRLMLPGQKLLALGKFLKDSTDMELYFSNAVAVFESPSAKTSISVRVLDGREYPPVSNLLSLPFHGGYTVEPKQLLNSLKRIKILLPENKLVVSNSLMLKFENENIQISHECDLFVENVACKILPIDGIESPKVLETRLNLDYLNAALSPLVGGECDMKINVAMAAISSNTLGGNVTHLIATVSKRNQSEE